MTSFAAKRLGKELVKIRERLPDGITLISAEDFKEWYMDLAVLDNNLIYNGKVFRLRLRFNDKYPIEPPEVVFLNLSSPPRTIPMHPHVYSNGIICLDLLGNAWSPVQNVESVTLSLQSMLTGNNKNERPPGDEEFCRRVRNPGSGKIRDMAFVYEDDTV